MNSMSQAQNEFNRARNRAAWEQLFGLVTGKNYDLVDYNDVRKRLANAYNIPILKEIPLDSIVGTVSRNQDFSRTFLPKLSQDQSRWVNVKMANESLEGVPPIDVYQIGQIYFVLDGHHRVSVMKSIGAEYIQAHVRVINTDVPLKPTDSPDEIIVKTERQAFLDRSKIDKLIPGNNIFLKQAGQYPQLWEHIQVHKYFMGLDYQRDIEDDEAVVHWYEEVYLPVVKVIENMRLMDEFTDKTETDLYLWLENNKAELSEEYGGNVRTTALAWKLDNDFGKRKRNIFYKLARRIAMAFSSDLSDWGVKTGDWRKEFLQSEHEPLERMMISMVDFTEDKEFLASAIEFSKNYQAWVGVVHVVPAMKYTESPTIDYYREGVETMLEEADVRGKFVVLAGPLIRNLSERAFWSDISFFKMRHRPDADAPFENSWNAIITNIPGLICIAPDVLPKRINHIVLGFSASAKAREAMYFSEALARTAEAMITVVISGFDVMKRDTALAEAMQFFEGKEISVNYVTEEANPEDSILKVVNERHGDVIMMGGYSRSWFKRLITKSTVEEVLSETTVPVFLCK